MRSRCVGVVRLWTFAHLNCRCCSCLCEWTLCNYITLSLCATTYSTFLTNFQFLNAVFFCLFCFCKEMLRRPQSRHLEVKERLALVFIQHTFIQNRTSHLLYILFWKEKYNHQRCEENLCCIQTGTLCWWNAHCKTKICSFTDRICTEALKVSFLILIYFIFPPVFIFLSWLFLFSICENYRF